MLFKALKFTGGLALAVVGGAVDSVDDEEQVDQDINANTNNDAELNNTKRNNEIYELIR